jgi:hypothetical protein
MRCEYATTGARLAQASVVGAVELDRYASAAAQANTCGGHHIDTGGFFPTQNTWFLRSLGLAKTWFLV